MVYRIIKRGMDIAGALLALLLFSPFMLWAAYRIYRSMGTPILFRQVRPGLDQKPFTILKFRTMRDAVDANGNPLSDEERLTPFGERMRSMSIDELPQLFNILKGEMSFVGPRPLLFDFFPFYSATEMRRHEVKPGITGWAQIHGRNNLDWDKRLAMDIWYVDHWTPWLDIAIILKTALTVIRREGITTEGYATFLRLDDHRRKQAEAAKN
jgi:lipopolysaccharide/colanic/teichoic acid biosynthesis glycosyltransferase